MGLKPSRPGPISTSKMRNEAFAPGHSELETSVPSDHERSGQPSSGQARSGQPLRSIRTKFKQSRRAYPMPFCDHSLHSTPDSGLPVQQPIRHPYCRHCIGRILDDRIHSALNLQRRITVREFSCVQKSIDQAVEVVQQQNRRPCDYRNRLRSQTFVFTHPAYYCSCCALERTLLREQFDRSIALDGASIYHTMGSADYLKDEDDPRLQKCIDLVIRAWRRISDRHQQFHVKISLFPADSLINQGPTEFIYLARVTVARGVPAVYPIRFIFDEALDNQLPSISVLFQDHVTWSLTHFLDQLRWMEFTKSMPSSPHVPAGDMMTWWQSNGKAAFDLFDLPLEIRRTIYLCSFGYVVQPITLPTTTHFTSKLNKSLLLTSKAVKDEVLNTVLLKSTFYFDTEPVLHHMFHRYTPTITSVKRLELSFSHIDYMKFFGWGLTSNANMRVFAIANNFPASTMATLDSIDSQRGDWGKTDAERLREMRLDSLVLWMPHPDRMDSQIAKLAQGCQSTVVNMILGHAWPFIMGHPMVVTGFVRPDDKKEFEGYVAKAVKFREEWEKETSMIVGSRESEKATAGKGESDTCAAADNARLVVGSPRSDSGNSDAATCGSDSDSESSRDARETWRDAFYKSRILDKPDDEDADDNPHTLVPLKLVRHRATGSTVTVHGNFQLRKLDKHKPMSSMVPSELSNSSAGRLCRCGMTCDKLDTWHLLDSRLATSIPQLARTRARGGEESAQSRGQVPPQYGNHASGPSTRASRVPAPAPAPPAPAPAPAGTQADGGPGRASRAPAPVPTPAPAQPRRHHGRAPAPT
ncbi:WD repeat-containing protein mip1 [Sphaceloma murrayae]|uniref:WD repeat-containing protein mip1 n=1 Tax=Sphaceloma murrayae TaxID=2082308 RepID=A0A2K1R3L8_9PEZI|nr:WD repeat-containing protein mip1 [Sphaceloma murrayae]